MKKFIFISAVIANLLTSCIVSKEGSYSVPPAVQNIDTNISSSLFNDKNSSISEENIQRILDGKYSLPAKLKAAVINIEQGKSNNSRYYYRGFDNEYLTSRQRYIENITENLTKHQRISKISWVPSMMTGTAPTFTSIREAAVRMQADIVIVYSLSEGNIYTKEKMFSTEYKAFATTQTMIMDVRTGLIPYTDISTKEYMIPKEEKDNKEFNDEEKRRKIQEQAVLLTLQEINNNISKFLNQ